MSDQTPDTSQDVTDGNEPSMEDILASIRKIIADDDAGDVAIDAGGSSVASEASSEILTPILANEAAAVELSEALDLEAAPADNVNDLEIDSILDGLGIEDESLTPENVIESELDLATLDFAEDEAVLDLEIPFVEDTPVEQVPAPSNLEDVAADSVSVDMDDDLNSMLDNLLADEEAPELELAPEPESLADIAQAEESVEADQVEDELANILDEVLQEDTLEDTLSADIEDEAEPLEFAQTEVESDMDLVKSLMADLTEKPYSVEDELDVILSETSQPETLEDEGSISVEDAELQDSLAALISDDDAVEDESADMMDEILNMTLYDEANLQESTIAAETEAVQASENVDIDSLEMPELEMASELEALSELEIPSDLDMPSVLEIPAPEQTPEQNDAAELSLQDIAQAAQSDAASLEEGSIIEALGGGVALGAAATALSMSNDESPDVEEDKVSAIQTPDDIDSLLSRLDNIIETPEDDIADELSGEVEAETAEEFEIEIIEDFEDSLSETDLEEDDVVDTIETIETLKPVTLNEETPLMPRAVKSETIIDEVTETATVGAFASLNQAVEEKATVAERGDRIGDLVMESLRPMLKEWLDGNLKGIVERAVTKEVKRISSGK